MGSHTGNDGGNWSSGQPQQYSSYQNADYSAATQEAAYVVQNDDDIDFSGGGRSSWGPAVQGFVQCVSDACKLGASGIVAQNASFAKSGYEAIKNVIVSETQERMPSVVERPRGEFESVPVVSYHRGGR